jgi:Alpha amylase, catalytic domain
MRLISGLSLALMLAGWCRASAPRTVQIGEATDWWQKTVFYQIYPRSFKDSNGDGVGDLRGIIEMLPHLADLGVGATWLSPIMKSPMVDFGYDVEDFTEIAEIFGDMADFDELMVRANELGKFFCLLTNVGLEYVPGNKKRKFGLIPGQASK